MLGFHISGDNAADRLKGFNPMPRAESCIIRGVRERTSRGEDANNAAFSPYRPRTVKARAKRGLKTGIVTLRAKTEDSLLDTLGAERIDENNSEISVASDRLGQATGLQTGHAGNHEQAPREFIGVSELDERDIEEDLVREFERMFA